VSDSALIDVLRSAHDSIDLPLGEARSLPAALYTDPAIFALERKALLLTGWLFVGRTEGLSERGAYRAVDTAGGPVLLIRGEDGVLRAFANSCRHRGSILLEDSGTCRRIVCPYHAWSYHLDGQLAHAPEMDAVEGFNPDDNALAPLRVDCWAGFLFICFDETTPPLLETLGDLPVRMASHRPEEMRHVWSTSLDCACNWKLLLENAVEAYHTGLVHKKTVGAQQSRDIETKGDWVCIQVLSDRSVGTLPDATPGLPTIDELDTDAQAGTYFTILLPTCQLVFSQDCLWWLVVRPVAVDRSVLEIGGCFPQSSTELPNFQALAAPYLHRWEAVGREDVGILEKQQCALASVRHRPGLLGPREGQVRRFDAWVVKRLLEKVTPQEVQ